MSESPVSVWSVAIQFALGLLAMILALISVVASNSNRDLQNIAGANQTSIDRANTFANLDNSLIQLLAKSATDNNDAALTRLLADNGVTFQKPGSAPDRGAKP